ncbi:MAG: hypothetical protein L0Z73_02880 [Gammaproteobacteria bacterium]|nr:hypothetical protein [Gammaproteobacteria bacterium]
MSTSEYELKGNAETVKDADNINAESAADSLNDTMQNLKSNASFNYSARKKIEEYLENKILTKLTRDTFDDYG